MEVLNSESFKAKIFNYDEGGDWKYRGSKPAIIDFYADWCGPCRALAPILDQISKEYSGMIDIYKIDTEASPELALLFEIRSIPSLLFIPMNGELAMSQGLLPAEELRQAIKDLLNITLPN